MASGVGNLLHLVTRACVTLRCRRTSACGLVRSRSLWHSELPPSHMLMVKPSTPICEEWMLLEDVASHEGRLDLERVLSTGHSGDLRAHVRVDISMRCLLSSNKERRKERCTMMLGIRDGRYSIFTIYMRPAGRLFSQLIRPCINARQ